ncbi:MAG: RibD family protein [Pseudomonadota bacterium]
MPSGSSNLTTLKALEAARHNDRPLVVAQLGQSLDGRIATPTGHSHYINGQEAITVLHELRAAVDAVVVGAGTAAADDPQLTVRRCAGENPARVLIDRRRRAGSHLKMLAEDGAARIVVGPPRDHDPDGLTYLDIGTKDAPANPTDVLAALSGLGYRRVLVEGGSVTVSHFLAAGVVARLCVLVAPLIIGSGPQGIALPDIDVLDEAMRPQADVFPLQGGDVVFDCDLTGA